jgi:hypothetical protein
VPAPGVRSLANEGEEGAAGWWPTSPKLKIGQEACYTRELATDHEQYLSGHGESPGGGTAPTQAGRCRGRLPGPGA